jgi:cobalt-zinc-cadmium efflux system outer membrane protein
MDSLVLPIAPRARRHASGWRALPVWRSAWRSAWRAAGAAAALGTAPLAAQPAPPLDLAGALSQARSTAPALRAADARGEAAAGRAREAAQYPNPTLEWRRENLGSALLPDIFTTAYLPVDVTGRRLALREAGRAGVRRAAADAVADRRGAEWQVAQGWLRAAMAEGMRAALASQAAALEALAATNEARLREGTVAEAEALRTRLEADRARLALATAEGEQARARGELARLLGMVPGGLPPLAALTPPALPDAPDSVEAMAVARRARPELAAREAGVREAAARLRAEQRGVLGDAQLQGGSKVTGGFLTGQVGVAVPLPLFNRNAGARQRARGELAEAEAAREDAEGVVAGGVHAAWLAYRALRATAGAASAFGARGAAIVASARVAYREGHASLLELLDAERAAVEAARSALGFAAEAWAVRLELERALGARLAPDGPYDLPLLSTLPPAPSPSPSTPPSPSGSRP